MSELKIAGNMCNSDDFYSKFTLGARLGCGMSSTVYECLYVDPSRNHVKLAVKIVDLLKGDISEEALRKEVEREIDLLEVLNGHPSIINIVTSMETIANIFIITDLCEEGDLYDYMSERITLPSSTTMKVMQQLISALTYIHSRFIAHRDIKLENILISNRYNLIIKLADFGAAVRLVHDKELTEIVGTPTYYAPELIKTAMGEAIGYGRKVDVWACGVVMYSLLLGRPPFSKRQPNLLYRTIMKGSYDKNDSLWQNMKPKLKMMIEKMLDIDPQTRIETKELQKICNQSFFAFRFPALSGRKTTGHISFFAVSIAVRACIRFYQSMIIKVSVAKEDPFSFRRGREILTSMALEIYGHWIKRDAAGHYGSLHSGFKHQTTDVKSAAYTNTLAPISQTNTSELEYVDVSLTDNSQIS